MRRSLGLVAFLTVAALLATPRLRSAGAAEIGLRSGASPPAAMLLRQALRAFRVFGSVHITTNLTETAGHTSLSVRGSEDMSLRDHRSIVFESETTGQSPHTPPPLKGVILADGPRTAQKAGGAPWFCTVGVPYPLAVDPTLGYHAVDPGPAGRGSLRGQSTWLVHAGVIGPGGVRGSAQYEISRAHSRLLELRATVMGTSTDGSRPELHETISYSRYGEHFPTHLPAGCVYHRNDPSAVQAFRVAGFGMYPTLKDGQWVWVNKNAYRENSVRRGDIVVFNATPAGPQYRDEDFIKRIIGLPGETVAIHSGSVYINHHRLAESYIGPFHRPTYTFAAQVIPPHEYFVLGDNRNDSQDSHIWGFLPRQYIVGRVVIDPARGLAVM